MTLDSEQDRAVVCAACSTVEGCEKHQLFTCSSCGKLTSWSGKRYDKETKAYVPDERGSRDYYGARAFGARHRVYVPGFSLSHNREGPEVPGVAKRRERWHALRDNEMTSLGTHYEVTSLGTHYEVTR